MEEENAQPVVEVEVASDTPAPDASAEPGGDASARSSTDASAAPPSVDLLDVESVGEFRAYEKYLATEGKESFPVPKSEWDTWPESAKQAAYNLARLNGRVGRELGNTRKEAATALQTAAASERAIKLERARIGKALADPSVVADPGEEPDRALEPDKWVEWKLETIAAAKFRSYMEGLNKQATALDKEVQTEIEAERRAAHEKQINEWFGTQEQAGIPEEVLDAVDAEYAKLGGKISLDRLLDLHLVEAARVNGANAARARADAARAFRRPGGRRDSEDATEVEGEPPEDAPVKEILAFFKKNPKSAKKYGY